MPQLTMIFCRDYLVCFSQFFSQILSLLLYYRCPPIVGVCVFFLFDLFNPLFITLMFVIPLPIFLCGFLQSAGMKNLLAQDSTLCIDQSSSAFISLVLPGKGHQNTQKASSMMFSCQQLFNELPLWNFSFWRDRIF